MSYHPNLLSRSAAAWRPYKAETFPRVGSQMGNTSILASGRLHLVGIFLPAGLVVTNIAFWSATTALSSGTNQWFSLWDAAIAKLAVTSDDTSTAWPANTEKSLALTSPYTVPSSGRYYLGLTVVATTPPTMATSGSINAIAAKAPNIGGASTTGLTDPASAPSTAVTPSSLSQPMYAGVT